MNQDHGAQHLFHFFALKDGNVASLILYEQKTALAQQVFILCLIELNCIVIHELFVTTELPNDELTSIRT